MLNVSHPGRYGDLAWALPTVRALAAQHGPVRLHLPVDPANTTPMIAIKPLLEAQPYIAEVVVREDWSIEQEAPRRPFYPPFGPEYYEPSEGWAHLAYLEWPTAPLPFYTAQLADLEWEPDWLPWITIDHAGTRKDVLFSWSDRWYELKYGLTAIVWNQLPDEVCWLVYPDGSRWQTEGGPVDLDRFATPILGLARMIAMSRLVVTDCSMAHVLAAAIGTPCVVVEPEEARHHPIFWPGSVQDQAGHWHQADNRFGELIYPVIGGDGKPTFDARATAALIKEVLNGR